MKRSRQHRASVVRRSGNIQDDATEYSRQEVACLAAWETVARLKSQLASVGVVPPSDEGETDLPQPEEPMSDSSSDSSETPDWDLRKKRSRGAAPVSQLSFSPLSLLDRMKQLLGDCGECRIL